MREARPICLVLERQDALRALSRACANTGNKIAARMAIIAITTSNSMSVNPVEWRFICILLGRLGEGSVPWLRGNRKGKTVNMCRNESLLARSYWKLRDRWRREYDFYKDDQGGFDYRWTSPPSISAESAKTGISPV